VEINCLNLIFPLTREESGKTETRVPALYDACPGRRYPPQPFGQRKKLPHWKYWYLLGAPSRRRPKKSKKEHGLLPKNKKKMFESRYNTRYFKSLGVYTLFYLLLSTDWPFDYHYWLLLNKIVIYFLKIYLYDLATYQIS